MKLTVSGTLNLELEEEEPRLRFDIMVNGVTVRDIKMLVLPIDHTAIASITPVDAKGNPAPVEGAPIWASSNPTMLTVTPRADDGSGSYKADLAPVGAVGTCQVNVSADADLGSGVSTITGILDVQTAAGQAVGFTISTELVPPA
jgi:hypothetical protein